ncbi:hypothetical protein [Noviherbaspirillum aridicola]|nr:hypothetical protein [Noviherbaspirillum aridicola]
MKMEPAHWQEYREAMQAVARAFGTTVLCSQKYQYLRVQFDLSGLTGDQVRALGTLSHLVEIASEFPRGFLGGLELPNAALAYAMQVLGSEAAAREWMRAPST